jgi:hypothetical protein
MVLDDYFYDRHLLYTTNGNQVDVSVTSGIPQGSILGPTLWNVLYNGLLKERLPPDTEFIAYADDLALVARSKYNYELEDKLSRGAEVVRAWLLSNGLQLATDKSEIIIFTRTRT